MNGLLRFITSAKTSWIVLVLAVFFAGGTFFLGSGAGQDTAPTVELPDSDESVKVDNAGPPSALHPSNDRSTRCCS